MPAGATATPQQLRQRDSSHSPQQLLKSRAAEQRQAKTTLHPVPGVVSFLELALGDWRQLIESFSNYRGKTYFYKLIL